MLLKEKIYTYEDYMNLPEGTRAELINGVIYNISPSPNLNHQRLRGWLYLSIGNYLKGKKCEVFNAPFDVFLVKEDEVIGDSKVVVQPDITVICDKNKLVKQGCKGTPDFIIEIVSPSTKARDYITKLSLYSDYGVKEYWIVNPNKKTITTYLQEDNSFGEPQKYTFDDKIKVSIFESLEIDFSEIELL